MNVLICDDEKYITDCMVNMCKQYQEATGKQLNVLAINDFDERGNFEADVIFLDVEMPNKNGILIKNELERLRTKSLIIFVTNYIGNVYDAFGTNVIGFFQKPLTYMQFCDLMQKVDNLLLGEAVIEIEPYLTVRANDIRYIRMDGVYAEIYLVNDKGTKPRIVRKSLTEWENILPADVFMTINKSSIVNCGHIDRYEQDSIVMDGIGEKLSISRRRKKDCLQKYDQYCRMMARYGR